jgi:hypothetical protein
MEKGSSGRSLFVLTILVGLLMVPPLIFAKEAVQKWELINPEGTVKVTPMEVNRHPATLEGKTVMLRWNGKHNGDEFLNRVAELLTAQVKGVKIIKSWEVVPETANMSRSPALSKDWAKKLAPLKPDIVIGSTGD